MQTSPTPATIVKNHPHVDYKKDIIARWSLRFQHTIHRHTKFLLCIILILAGILRFTGFTSLPAGINQDEASAAYETYSLLTHGTDRWGNKFPVYFPSWGSGQNVLQSYLNIPFIKLFGLTTFGARFLPALLSILTIAVLYALLSYTHNHKTALLAAFLLSITPWHIILSRWSLESNLLPCFLLLGVSWMIYCYTSPHIAKLLPFSLIFLALACYAYGVAVLVLPGMLGLYFLTQYKVIRTHALSFAASLSIFLLISGPFLLFILDNDILHSTPSFILRLPFTVPLLISNRLDQISGGQNILLSNTRFFTSEFRDGLPWNDLDWFQPLGIATLPAAAFGTYYSLTKKQGHAAIFVIWLIATLPLFFLVPLNMNRGNAIFLPLIALSAIGISGVYQAIKIKRTQWIFLLSALALIVSYSGLFCVDYFNNYNSNISYAFNAGLDQALQATQKLSQDHEPIYLTNSIPTNYVYLLFFLKIDPVDFQTHAQIISAGDTYMVLHYRNYYFYPNDPKLASSPSYIAVLKGGEQLQCQKTQPLYTQGYWLIERCFNP